MKFSIITPCWNSRRYLEACVQSVAAQRGPGLEVEYIVVDGGSTDGSLDLLRGVKDRVDILISEPDRGPADAINKGFARATGEVVGWLNADDFYYPGALRRAAETMARHSTAAFCFGPCRIVDEGGAEIRRGITRFKEMFFPFSSRFTFQCINYISQPATFFRRDAVGRAGPLREDLKAAFDYEFLLRLWRQGGGVRMAGRDPVSAFRWHDQSISGRHFARQFKEELDAARGDAGRVSVQALIHSCVRWGIVGSYAVMAGARQRRGKGEDRG